MKPLIIVLGLLSAVLIVTQLVMGLLIVNGADVKLKTIHQHSGYMTVSVVLVYIFLSLSKIASTPKR